MITKQDVQTYHAENKEEIRILTMRRDKREMREREGA